METSLPALVPTILHPERLFSTAEIIGNPTLVPACPGIYGWYFDSCTEILPGDFCEGCYRYQRKTLLYFGIARKNETSHATLNSRIISQHLNGNAEGSTRNAFVSFATAGEPWRIETEVVGKPHTLSLPLNIKGNSKHPFYKILRSIRQEAIKQASKLPRI